MGSWVQIPAPAIIDEIHGLSSVSWSAQKPVELQDRVQIPTQARFLSLKSFFFISCQGDKLNMISDIHKSCYRIGYYLKRLERSKRIHEENKSAIKGFYHYCVSNGLSKARIAKLLQHMVKLSLIFQKPFVKATKEDVMKLVERIETENYSDWTKRDYKVVLRKFFKWLRNTEGYPEEVRWIKACVRNRHRLPEELLSEEDVSKMAEVADNSRDRAFVLVLYESGCRIGELLSLRIKSVRFDDYGAILLVNGKTGQRRVRIIVSSPALSNWMDHHPFKTKPDNPLWIGVGTRNRYKAMSYPSARVVLQKLARKAGIRKKVNPHAFRYARATHLASKLTEAQMKEYLGWVQGSDMACVYVHMSGRDVDKALLKLYGLTTKEDGREETFKVRTCAKCKERNDPVSQFCKRCGSPMDLRIALDLRDKQKEKDEVVALVVKELVTKLEIEKLVYETIKRLGLEGKFERV